MKIDWATPGEPNREKQDSLLDDLQYFVYRADKGDGYSIDFFLPTAPHRMGYANGRRLKRPVLWET